jgi:Response regulator containing a CheY-like receiver domain and an HTH DNA-binding domain
MATLVEKLFKEYQELLDFQKINPEELDYSILNKHIAMLERLNVIESSSISIFDTCKRDHIFVSRGFEAQLGWSIDEIEKEGHHYIDSRVHPDDLIGLLESGIYYLQLAFNEVPKNEWKNYKVISDYRVKNKNGDYVRVIEQHICLEFTREGFVWLDLSIMDLSPDQDLTIPFRSRLMNFKTGELFEYKPVVDQNKNIIRLSIREKEVLKLIATGMVSKQIADKLFISVNTVNTHRQNIIEKLNVSNTAEAIKYASEVGWLS